MCSLLFYPNIIKTQHLLWKTYPLEKHELYIFFKHYSFKGEKGKRKIRPLT